MDTGDRRGRSDLAAGEALLSGLALATLRGCQTRSWDDSGALACSYGWPACEPVVRETRYHNNDTFGHLALSNGFFPTALVATNMYISSQ